MKLERDYIEFLLNRGVKRWNITDLLKIRDTNFELLLISRKIVNKNSTLHKITVQVQFLETIGIDNIDNILFDKITNNYTLFDILQKNINIKSNFFILSKLLLLSKYINCDF